MPTELEQAQARRIEELEQRLSERNRALEGVAGAMAEEIRRREEAQDALIAAQKVEAIGHLAGGLAHDLRSVLLTVALGYDVLLQELQGDPLVEEVVRNGKAAVKQAGDLVKRMLGFARPGPERITEVNLGEYLPSLEVLLGYAAGRQVAVRVRAEPGVWPVRVDEQGLGAALINLAVNARDAMPDGGELSVVAGNVPRAEERPAGVPAGDMVVLAVSDTGRGMSPEVLARATEPLFTTKPPGRGTGLGLYMAQRFALAAGGHLRLQSAPEVGTLVELYLPRWEAGATLTPGAPAACDGPALVAVEDELGRTGIAGPPGEARERVREGSSAEARLALAGVRPRPGLVVADADPVGGPGCSSSG